MTNLIIMSLFHETTVKYITPRLFNRNVPLGTTVKCTTPWQLIMYSMRGTWYGVEAQVLNRLSSPISPLVEKHGGDSSTES